MASTVDSISKLSEGPVLTIISKRLRAHRKKYDRIIETEGSVNRGKTINPEQEKLIHSKPAVTAIIDELEKLHQSLSDAVKEEHNLALKTHQADENVEPGETHCALGHGVREHFSSSSSLSDIGMEVQSGSSMVASSRCSSSSGLSSPLRIEPDIQFSSNSHEDIMFVVYTRTSRYIVKAFERSGELIPSFCFTVDLFSTPLPYHCGFGAVGSTLYMIGGCIFDELACTHVINLVTYKIDFGKIPQFPNQSIPPDFGDLVEVGPHLHAKKESPIVIMVGSKIYVFSRFLLVRDESPKNFECLKSEAEGWELLPEPPFRKGEGKGTFRCYEIVSHVVEREDSIVIRITGEGDPGTFKLNLDTHLWSSVGPEAVNFSGKAVCFNNVYYAFMDHRIDHLANRVVYFRSPFSSEVEEVAEIQPCPEEVCWLHKCEFASMGASIFIARTGYSSMQDHIAEEPSHHLTVENFEVSMVEGKAKAIKPHVMSFELKVSDAAYTMKSLYFVRWVRGGRMQQARPDTTDPRQ